MSAELPGWQGRLGEASYESPSGIVLSFQFEDVSKSFAKHTTGYDFVNADGTFVQELGRSGRRVPLRIFFSGDDNDLQADVFDEMLAEHGVGTLNHPRYGSIQVIPFGDIARQDPLVTNTNQTIFNVTFWETNGLLFPLDSESPGDQTQAAVVALLAANPQAFVDAIDDGTVIESRTLVDDIRAVSTAGKNGLAGITGAVASIQRRVDAIDTAIQTAINTLIGTPLTLAFQVGQMLTQPARSIALISDRLTAYSSLLVDLTTGGTVLTPSTDSTNSNRFRNTDMQSSVLLAGMVESILDADFTTRSEAIGAADTLLDVFDQWAVWRDNNLSSLGAIDTGEQYEAARLAIMLAAGFLVSISFLLKQERSIVTIRPRSPLDLEAELYGTVEENLDLLILSNDFVGLEILEVPAGRRVVFFV